MVLFGYDLDRNQAPDTLHMGTAVLECSVEMRVEEVEEVKLEKSQAVEMCFAIFVAFLYPEMQGCRFVPYTFSETKPQMVPMDLNIGETRVWL